MIDLKAFHKCLHDTRVEFITGVPDTLLNDFCLSLESDWPVGRHVIAANEGNAIALAAGYHLATGTIPLVYMQNSGLGNATNPLISLVDKEVYGIPMVLLIGWRGEPGSSDWPQHRRQGELTPVFLDAMDIPYRVVSTEAEAFSHIVWAVETAAKKEHPTALLARKGVFALPEKAGFEAQGQRYSVSREEAINCILSAAPSNAVFVATTGRASRELHALRQTRNEPHDRDFLNVGAMGHALSIAAGIAVGNKDRPVICLDGDGAALMHMGSLAVAAALDAPNLLHIVLNNGAHESVGGQTTLGFFVDFCAVAKNLGYLTVVSPVSTSEGLGNAVKSTLESVGPSFIEVRIRKGMRPQVALLKMNPNQLKQQMMRKISCSN